MSKNRRGGIYEATEKEYNTSAYRDKLCHEWLSYQTSDPAQLLSPTDIEMNHPTATQRTLKRPKQAVDLSQPKKQKPLDDDIWNDDDNFIEPFLHHKNSTNKKKSDVIQHKRTHDIQTDRKPKSYDGQVAEPPHYVFRSYAEVMDTTPMWKKRIDEYVFDDDEWKKDFQTKCSNPEKHSRYDRHDRHDRHDQKHRSSGKHNHGKPVSDVLKKYEHPLATASKAFQAFKTLSNYTGGGTAPIICNIKCVNLIIKTD